MIKPNGGGAFATVYSLNKFISLFCVKCNITAAILAPHLSSPVCWNHRTQRVELSFSLVFLSLIWLMKLPLHMFTQIYRFHWHARVIIFFKPPPCTHTAHMWEIEVRFIAVVAEKKTSHATRVVHVECAKIYSIFIYFCAIESLLMVINFLYFFLWWMFGF